MFVPAEYKPEYLIAFGHIEAEWNQLESLLFVIFKRFIGARGPKAGAAYFALANHRARRDMIEKLAPHVLMRPAARKQFASLISRVATAAKKRNEVIHTFWAWQDGTPWAIWPQQTRINSPDLLKEFRTRVQIIKKVREDLAAFYDKLPHGYGQWPPKRPQFERLYRALRWVEESP